uniref:Uncharacterized protein n=1 Tax=Bombyx mori TaxID=7091 RepID=A0A8R2LYA3_BOMMO|nr:histone-lysine N-methyltransferase set-17-like [Bombyx mori]
MNLRKRQRISYYEPDEPNLDEYIFCDSCRDYVYEYCSVHGPLLVIPDDKVRGERENNTFGAFNIIFEVERNFRGPSERLMKFLRAGLGVFSTLTLPQGVQFGPYRGQRTDQVDSMYCWQVGCRTTHDP